jgi:hypothetical protein
MVETVAACLHDLVNAAGKEYDGESPSEYHKNNAAGFHCAS